MTKLSRAQSIFLNDILKYDKQETIDENDVRNSLVERGICFTEEEFDALIKSLKFEKNQNDCNISRLELYANAHLFNFKSDDVISQFKKRIAIGCGVGITDVDLNIFEKFS